MRFSLSLPLAVRPRCRVHSTSSLEFLIAFLTIALKYAVFGAGVTGQRDGQIAALRDSAYRWYNLIKLNDKSKVGNYIDCDHDSTVDNRPAVR